MEFVAPEEDILAKFLPSMEEGLSNGIVDNASALRFLEKKTTIRKEIEVVLNTVLAHVNPIPTTMAKVPLLLVMVRRLLLASQDPRWIDSKDFVGNKRFDMSGDMLYFVFEDAFKQFNETLKAAVGKHLATKSASELDIRKIIAEQAGTITQRLRVALSTGNWNIKRYRINKRGVSEKLNRLNFIASWGERIRIQSQVERTRKVRGPRSLQPSHWGYICPTDTPEGATCGIVKSFAQTTHVTINIDPASVTRLIRAQAWVRLFVSVAGAYLGSPTADEYLIFVNGEIVGATNAPAKAVDELRRMRRQQVQEVDQYTSIQRNDMHRAVYVETTGCRLTRPLFIIRNGHTGFDEETLQVKSFVLALYRPEPSGTNTCLGVSRMEIIVSRPSAAWHHRVHRRKRRE